MHESQCTRQDCDVCSRLVCRCLQVTETALVEALAGREIKTVKDIRRLTGAGDGCNACHKILKTYLEGFVLATT